MKEFTIPVWWMVSAEVKVKANSLDDAIKLVDKDPTAAGVPEHGDYIDGSLTIDHDCAAELNEGS